MTPKRTGGWPSVEIRDGDLPASAYTHRLAVGQMARSAIRGAVKIQIRAEAVEILGHHGRLLSASKSAYQRQHPEHTVFFNACVFDRRRCEIWFGDIDLTLEDEKLQALADRLGQRIYLTREQPYRFDGLRRRDLRQPNPDQIRVYRPRRGQR